MKALRVGLGMVGVAVLAFGTVAACGGSDSGSKGGGGGAGATDGGGATGGGGTTGTGATGATGGGGTGGTAAGECKTAAECAAKLPSTTPPNCAEAECDAVLGKCVFKAKDADGDGHGAVYCVPTGAGTIEEGDDCEDSNPDIFPGAELMACAEGLGECKVAGFVDCKGYEIVCSAVPGTPSPDSPICDGKDHDCNGIPNTGCSCVTGGTQSCGACNDGTSTCVSGTWGPCAGGTQNYGAACGSCGGTVQCGGACSKSTPANWNQSCGSCGGKIQCDGTCSIATPGNFGTVCQAGTGACQKNGTFTCSGCSVGGGTPSSDFHNSPAANGSWDWNCDGVVEPYWGQPAYHPADSYCATSQAICASYKSIYGACPTLISVICGTSWQCGGFAQFFPCQNVGGVCQGDTCNGGKQWCPGGQIICR